MGEQKSEKLITKKETRGRKLIAIDWDKLNTLLQYKATITDCADILGISIDTLERAIKREHSMLFSEYRDLKMSRMRMKLAQKQFELAMDGNVTMLVWLGKQYLGQTDKQEMTSEITHRTPTTITIVPETIIEIEN